MHWRHELRDFASILAGRLAGELGNQALRAIEAVERVVERDPPHVVGYRGYGTAERALVLCRALRDAPVAPPHAAHSRWRNLLDALRRIETDPIPRAHVHATLGASTHELTADDEGFVRAWVPVGPPAASPGWHSAQVALAEPAVAESGREARPASASHGTAHVLVPAPGARYGVISDLDDTVLQSEVTNFLRAARMVLLENALTRLPFPGVAAFYRALAAGGPGEDDNPVFYVSSSPWNLYDVIGDFLEAQGIPTGPLLLRDWDIAGLTGRHATHKGAQIAEILECYPGLPFILIGDSGQEDPEIYAPLVRAHPGRILAIYIRNVTPHPERSGAIRRLADDVATAGSTLVLADDTLTIARHAATHGWISPATLADIGGETASDEGRTSEKSASPGVEQPAQPTPTVVVDPEVTAREIGGA